jgi:hypothetical protein
MTPEGRSDPRLIKSVETKDDGRRIVYYDRLTDAPSETGSDG